MINRTLNVVTTGKLSRVCIFCLFLGVFRPLDLPLDTHAHTQQQQS